MRNQSGSRFPCEKRLKHFKRKPKGTNKELKSKRNRRTKQYV